MDEETLLRDRFAMEAFKIFCASPHLYVNNTNAVILARDCYKLADAMMEARK